MRVYLVTSYANDVFYVRAETPEKAEDILRTQIKKYIFKQNLKDEDEDMPEILGKDVIVEFSIRKDIIEHDFTVEDITAFAYIFSSNGQPHWENWEIEIKDAVGNDAVAKSIEDMIDATDEEIKNAVANV